MLDDPELLACVEELANTDDIQVLHDRFEELLVRWSGLDEVWNAAGIEWREPTLTDRVWMVEAFSGEREWSPVVE